ncbi:endonuclease MutS2 [Metabacillus iocasae]|uniref:MutS2 family protein n=1 Tax=Priestia iocasae TaxID=2291674 RepID=A0ABS2QTX0_9BACI|nr:endonuclease MutS2 [Metabacillus iocasae]MBM7702928.1 MutS2 family protein [Metabacillus iocasae]
MNEMTMETLQYNELKERVKAHCVSGLGKELIQRLQPSSALNVVKTRLRETTEARRLLDAESHVPLIGISNIGSIVKKVEKGILLDPGELLDVSDFLRGCRRMKTFMLEKEFFAPMLSSYAQSMTELRSIEEEINASIKGNRVDSEASKELKRIRRHIETTEANIQERLLKFLRSSANKDYIQEFFISKKDDRYTIPIKASYKKHVQGTIVEASGKGSTVFIEPAAVAKLNNELAMLKAEEAVEEYQILATLSGMIMEQIAKLNVNVELIAQYDMVFAKGKYSRSIDGIEPQVNDHGYVNIVGGKHPLLPGNVVPLDFTIGEDYRGLIITGPNAGGKTVVLKTIGLLTLATMSGFHVEAKEETAISLFERIFVDIGDHQSIENALSTFSSHMKNMADILMSANHRTLLLFDEIGSGTEPNEGAALAIAIIEEFYQKGCITVATTHYGEIKRFSEMHPDFMNAAMKFNSETLEPLYQLLIGTSGDSNALWISKKMNISDSIIERAKTYMEHKAYNLDTVDESKKRKPKVVETKKETYADYEVGDKVKLLDEQESALIYKKVDSYNNVTVFYKEAFKEVNVKRIALELSASELYPPDYDLNTLFVSFKERKMQHDFDRGSKKAIKKVEKEMRQRKGENHS